jgi:16S rRNA (guanine966-N2)-methyltransferase
MAYRNEFRVIAGMWRHRRCVFPARQGLRPTPDRVRETLFNWLAPRLAGARCLDLFAGSGALGMEALSRGAREVEFVEKDAETAAAIEGNLAALGGAARVLVADSLGYLSGAPKPYDIVFLDPPFGTALLTIACERLAAGWLRTGARVYLEYPAAIGIPALPAGWRLLRQKRAGQVGFALAAFDTLS